MCAYTHVRTLTIEAASGSGGSVGVSISISVSGARGQRKMGLAKRHGVAWRGLAWCGVPAVPCRAVELDAARRGAAYTRCSCFAAICSAYAFVRVVYIDMYPVYMAHSVAVAASKRWDCAIRRVSKIEI